MSAAKARSQKKSPVDFKKWKNFLIKQVHTAARDMGMSRDIYELTLLRVTGKPSSSQCTPFELRRVVADFKERGWVPKSQARKKGETKPVKRTQDEVIEGLWLALCNRGAVGADPAEMRTWIKRQTKIDAPQFLRPEHKSKVIDALEAWLARVKRELGES